MLAACFPSPRTVSDSELPELVALRRIAEHGGAHIEHRVVCEIAAGHRRFPVYALTLGNPSPTVPAIGFFGGVHGLERIGAQVVLAYLHHLVMRLRWDSVLNRQLEQLRLVFMPVVNPGGMWRGTRANPNGVDLMRNAPLDSQERVPPLIGGQRISANLPWYRGNGAAPMEAENRALCEIVEQELLPRRFSMAIDCHSGFGWRDRIWFPYAHTATPIAHLPEMFALKEVFDQTHAHHRYVFEPQSLQYLTHGDIWDYLYMRACQQPARVLLPLTLEMGSWLWIKKNPRQLFSRHGIFNPLIEHRQQRVLRRHMVLLEFLARAACSFQRWLPDAMRRDELQRRASQHWYRL